MNGRGLAKAGLIAMLQLRMDRTMGRGCVIVEDLSGDYRWVKVRHAGPRKVVGVVAAETLLDPAPEHRKTSHIDRRR